MYIKIHSEMEINDIVSYTVKNSIFVAISFFDN